jgi:L-iditol 2-dehydrogenase
VKVALSVTPEQVRIEERPDPVAGPGEVVCRLLACGVCGSDVSSAWVARKVPAVLGHELVGEVVSLGAGAGGCAVGDRVVVHHHAPCGHCRRCLRGRVTLCAQFAATALDPGGFAERIRVPAELAGELLVVGDLDPERASFVEPLACVLRGLDRCGLGAGDGLLVVGAGTSGLLAIQAARARGAGIVTVREPRPERLERALALGAEAHDSHEVDVALVCTPDTAALRDAFAALGPGGVLGLYAPPHPGVALGLDGLVLYRAEIDVRASYSAGPADMRASLALIRSGAVDPGGLVTHRLPLGQTARALELARSGEALKALVLG